MFNNIDYKDVFSNNVKNNSINNSILVDEDKILNLVQLEISERINSTQYDIPKSFDDISVGTFSIMSDIDKTHKSGLISRDVAIKMIADLFISEGVNNRYKSYVDDLYLQKLKDIYELLQIKYEDLLSSLNSGKMSSEEFVQRYNKLQTLVNNLLSELLEENETLKKPR